MPQVQIVAGPAGSLVDFSSLAQGTTFTFGGVHCYKHDDSFYYDLANGQKKPIDPAQQVSLIAVTWEIQPFTVADVGVGDAFVDINGDTWIRVDGGAINRQDGSFADDGAFPDLQSTAKLTTIKIDE